MMSNDVVVILRANSFFLLILLLLAHAMLLAIVALLPVSPTKEFPTFPQNEIPFCVQTYETPFVLDKKLLKHKSMYANKANDIQRIITRTTKDPSYNGIK